MEKPCLKTIQNTFQTCRLATVALVFKIMFENIISRLYAKWQLDWAVPAVTTNRLSIFKMLITTQNASKNYFSTSTILILRIFL